MLFCLIVGLLIGLLIGQYFFCNYFNLLISCNWSTNWHLIGFYWSAMAHVSLYWLCIVLPLFVICVVLVEISIALALHRLRTGHASETRIAHKYDNHMNI